MSGAERREPSVFSTTCVLLAGALTVTSLLLNDDRGWLWWVLLGAAVVLVGVAGVQTVRALRRRTRS